MQTVFLNDRNNVVIIHSFPDSNCESDVCKIFLLFGKKHTGKRTRSNRFSRSTTREEVLFSNNSSNQNQFESEVIYDNYDSKDYYDSSYEKENDSDSFYFNETDDSISRGNGRISRFGESIKGGKTTSLNRNSGLLQSRQFSESIGCCSF